VRGEARQAGRMAGGMTRGIGTCMHEWVLHLMPPVQQWSLEVGAMSIRAVQDSPGRARSRGTVKLA
jgi:hypothetical protein